MTNTSLFKFHDRDIRVVEIDGQPWFVAADVCRSLGLSNVTMALQPLSQDERTLKNVEGIKSKANLLSEPGLYKLVQSSRKPEAKEFDRWVRHVVLPAIRKDGGYIHGEEHVPQIRVELGTHCQIGDTVMHHSTACSSQPDGHRSQWTRCRLKPEVP